MQAASNLIWALPHLPCRWRTSRPRSAQHRSAYGAGSILIASKRRLTRGDPELFATYLALATEARAVVQAHVDHLVGQLAQIIADGVARGEFTAVSPVVTARAVFDATVRFHNPAHAPEWSDSGIDAAFEGVWSLVLGGLGAHRAGA